MYLYAKDSYEPKCQHLINKREKVGLHHFRDPKAFIEYSNDMLDVYKNIEDYNPGKKRKILIVFEVVKLTSLAFLMVNHILNYLKMLDLILHTFLL